jgi:hypothetical protein
LLLDSPKIGTERSIVIDIETASVAVNLFVTSVLVQFCRLQVTTVTSELSVSKNATVATSSDETWSCGFCKEAPCMSHEVPPDDVKQFYENLDIDLDDKVLVPSLCR